MIAGVVITETIRADGLMLKLLEMDSGAFRVYMCNPPGRIEAREYTALEHAKKDFDRISGQGSTHSRATTGKD